MAASELVTLLRAVSTALPEGTQLDAELAAFFRKHPEWQPALVVKRAVKEALLEYAAQRENDPERCSSSMALVGIALPTSAPPQPRRVRVSVGKNRTARDRGSGLLWLWFLIVVARRMDCAQSIPAAWVVCVAVCASVRRTR